MQVSNIVTNHLHCMNSYKLTMNEIVFTIPRPKSININAEHCAKKYKSSELLGILQMQGEDLSNISSLQSTPTGFILSMTDWSSKQEFLEAHSNVLEIEDDTLEMSPCSFL